MKDIVGIVGLGNAGLAVARALSGSGAVAGFDLSPERRQLCMEAGLDVAADLRELQSRSLHALMLSLPKPEASLQVVAEVAGWERKPRLLIETSTITPDMAKRSAMICREAGMAYVDSAIAGGVASMAAGEITFFLGGGDADKALARPVLERIATDIFDLGPVGAGMGAKVVNNGVMHAVMVVLIEAFAMARKLDIPTQTLVTILNREEGLLRPLTHRVEERMQDAHYSGGMSVRNARKDSILALETAQQLGIPLFATQASHAPYEIAESMGLGDLDYAAIAKLWEGWSGVDFGRS